MREKEKHEDEDNKRSDKNGTKMLLKRKELSENKEQNYKERKSVQKRIREVIESEKIQEKEIRKGNKGVEGKEGNQIKG